MGETSLYDEDVFAWSEQQAAVLRRLAACLDLPNELDLAHVAEEIEDVGASELHAVRSFIRQILIHAIKSWADADAPSRRHGAAEIGNWHDSLVDRLTPAMRAKIDMTLLWRRALHQADLDLAAAAHSVACARVVTELDPAVSPIGLADVSQETLAVADPVRQIEAAARHNG